MIRVAVIGAGTIGKALTKKLREMGHFVLATTTTETKLQELAPSILYRAGDTQTLKTILSQVDIVIATLAPSNQSSYEEVYLEFANDLTALSKECTYLQKLIYTSSTSVYGEQEGEWVSEEIKPSPNSPSSKVLFNVEKKLANLPVKAFICFRLGEICTKERPFKLKLQKQTFPGTGENFTNLVHEDDIIAALIHSLSTPLQGNYNLVNDLHIPRKELYENLAKIFSLPQPRFDLSLFSPHSGNKRVANSKIKNTGFKFHYSGIDACLT